MLKQLIIRCITLVMGSLFTGSYSLADSAKEQAMNLVSGQHWSYQHQAMASLHPDTIKALKNIALNEQQLNIFRFRALKALGLSQTPETVAFLIDYALRYQDYPSQVAAAFNVLCAHYPAADDSVNLAIRLLDHETPRLRIMAAQYLHQHRPNHPMLSAYQARELADWERVQAFSR